jgi:hypothetical protein
LYRLIEQEAGSEPLTPADAKGIDLDRLEIIAANDDWPADPNASRVCALFQPRPG